MQTEKKATWRKTEPLQEENILKKENHLYLQIDKV